MKKLWIITLMIIGSFIITNHDCNAATLYLSPSATKVSVGDLVVVNVMVNTQTKIINNAEANLIFPNDLMEVVSVSTKRSIFSLWVEQPTYSNINGQITFNGGVPNPGYTGNGGEIISIVFKAKKVGTASFYLSDGAIRENDGLGTDILTGQGSVSVVVNAILETPAPETPIIIETKELAGLNIYASAWPNQNNWYNVRSSNLSWKLPSGVIAVQTAIGSIANAVPNINYRPAINNKNISNLTDGIWYFSLRYQMASGWSKISHYRIQIDNTVPKDLLATVIPSSTSTPSLTLMATDDLSGIDYYTIKIDDLSEIKVTAEMAKNSIILPMLAIGEHRALISVYDRAGNKAETNIMITVNAISNPVINNFPKQVILGQRAEFSGGLAPANKVITLIMDEKYQYQTITDSSGNFALSSDALNVLGTHSFYAYTGEKEYLSPIYNLEVIKPAATKAKIDFSINWRYLLIALGVGLILLLIASGWYKFWLLKKKIQHLESRSDQVLDMLFEKADKEIVVLKKLNKKKQAKGAENKTLEDLEQVIKHIEEIRG